jgi:hypothetical protein
VLQQQQGQQQQQQQQQEVPWRQGSRISTGSSSSSSALQVKSSPSRLLTDAADADMRMKAGQRMVLCAHALAANAD